METTIVVATDSDFEWIFQGNESVHSGLRLPAGGVDDRPILEHVRAIAARLRVRDCNATWMMVSSGEVVGLCGYHQPPSAEGEVEIGYNVASSRRRRGHATRAVAAILSIAKNDPAVKAVLASTPVDNIASQRVLERNGFARIGERSDPEDGELILWRIDATENEARDAYDSMYTEIADSAVYRQIVHRAFPDLPEWLIPYSVSPSVALLERIAQALNVGPNSSFVDLACGLGGPGLWVSERTGASLVGVDFSAVGIGAATTLARQRGIAQATFVNADATDTGLPAKTFDGLMSIDAIQFMDPRGVATEIARLLRPGGVAAVTAMEALVDGLPVATISKDYRAVFEAAGFSIRDYERIADGERNNALFESIEFYREPLLEEIGEAANPMLEEARDRLERAKAPPRVRKIFIAAQVRA